MSKSNVKPVALAVCTAIGGLALSSGAFASQQLAAGYMSAAADHHAAKDGEEGKCGEGKCGMDKVDADKDGKVSKAEFDAAHPDKADAFAGMDTNSDGFIDAEEHAAHKASKADGEGKCGEGKCGGAA